jgi:hypothetical protein
MAQNTPVYMTPARRIVGVVGAALLIAWAIGSDQIRPYLPWPLRLVLAIIWFVAMSWVMRPLLNGKSNA